MDVDAVNTALKTALAGVGGTVYDYVPDKVRPPAIILALGEGIYADDFDESMSARWVAHVVVARSDARNAQARIREYVAPSGTRSVRAAIQADKTLGGEAGDANVVDWSAPGSLEIGDGEYVTVAFAIEVED